MPFTFQITDGFDVFRTVAVNWRVCCTRMLADVGEMAIVTGAAGVMVTNAVFDTSPSGPVTTTGTDDFAAGALPLALSAVGCRLGDRVPCMGTRRFDGCAVSVAV